MRRSTTHTCTAHSTHGVALFLFFVLFFVLCCSVVISACMGMKHHSVCVCISVGIVRVLVRNARLLTHMYTTPAHTSAHREGTAVAAFRGGTRRRGDEEYDAKGSQPPDAKRRRREETDEDRLARVYDTTHALESALTDPVITALHIANETAVRTLREGSRGRSPAGGGGGGGGVWLRLRGDTIMMNDAPLGESEVEGLRELLVWRVQYAQWAEKKYKVDKMQRDFDRYMDAQASNGGGGGSRGDDSGGATKPRPPPPPPQSLGGHRGDHGGRGSSRFGTDRAGGMDSVRHSPPFDKFGSDERARSAAEEGPPPGSQRRDNFGGWRGGAQDHHHHTGGNSGGGSVGGGGSGGGGGNGGFGRCEVTCFVATRALTGGSSLNSRFLALLSCLHASLLRAFPHCVLGFPCCGAMQRPRQGSRSGLGFGVGARERLHRSPRWLPPAWTLRGEQGMTSVRCCGARSPRVYTRMQWPWRC